MHSERITFIGQIHSCYKQKFAVPRQPLLSPSARGEIELYSPFGTRESVDGLLQFSHIWVIFWFHQIKTDWKPMVRPPRLGGNKKTGLWATRTMFRPNPLGLSVVKLEDIIYIDQQPRLQISGMDIVDKTPVVDIKPYLGYSDAIADSVCGVYSAAPQALLQVVFDEKVVATSAEITKEYPEFSQLLTETIALQPKPAYQQEQGREYATILYRWNICWRIDDSIATVMAIEEVK